MWDPPFDRVPEQGPDWFLVGTEACGSGTPDLGLFLEVSVFIGIFGVGFTSRGSAIQRQGRRMRLGGRGRARPPTLLLARDSYGPTLLLQGLLLVQKTIVMKFQLIWTLFDIPFLGNSKTRKKQKWALGSRLIG